MWGRLSPATTSSWRTSRTWSTSPLTAGGRFVSGGLTSSRRVLISRKPPVSLSHYLLQGYFKDEERTLRTIDEEGWLHTGDIGEWTAWGTLRVIDKIKTVFKLANGDYVDPDRLEAVYVQSQYINQVRQNCEEGEA